MYSGTNQIDVQVPFESASIFFAQPRRLQVVSPGSAEVNDLPQSGSLGLFTVDGVHAAALNQDGTVNSASNPAASGSIVTLFGTGARWPSGIKDGSIATSAVSLDRELNRFLMIDLAGTPMNVLYAGAAPGLLYGVFQLNVQLPSGVAQPLTLMQLSNPIWLSTVSNFAQIYLK